MKDGAKLVSSVSDILEELGVKAGPVVKVADLNLSSEEKEILEIIKDESRHVDEIARELRKKVSDVSGVLLKLEILGVVKNLGGGSYVRG